MKQSLGLRVREDVLQSSSPIAGGRQAQACADGGKGLEGVLEGPIDLKEGRVSATKLVYTL